MTTRTPDEIRASLRRIVAEQLPVVAIEPDELRIALWLAQSPKANDAQIGQAKLRALFPEIDEAALTAFAESLIQPNPKQEVSSHEESIR